MTNIGIHVIAAIADKIDCRNHNLDIEIDLGDKFFDLLLAVEVLSFLNDGNNSCRDIVCAVVLAGDFDLTFIFDDRNTVYQAMMVQSKAVNIVTDKNIELINDMVSVSLLLPLLGQNIPSDDGNVDLDVVDSSDDSTTTLIKLHVEAVTTNKMKANELRMDVIHAAELLHHICGRSCSCCSCRWREDCDVVDMTRNIFLHFPFPCCHNK